MTIDPLSIEPPLKVSKQVKESRLPTQKPFSATAIKRGHGSKEFLFNLLNDCGNNDVSDLHVHPNIGMWRLTSGVLKKYDDADSIVTEEELVGWMEYADGYEDMGVDRPEKLLGTKGHCTVAFDTGTWRIRGSFRKTTIGISATFRLIPSKIPTVEDVYLPDVMLKMVSRKSGLILVEGPTGSGKTTSIAALIDYINTYRDLHIYSIEDPIEFHHKAKSNTVFTMREIGVHASDYPSAVENALRSKPNVIFIGEMLNNETRRSVLHAATTGHLVITTAHAGSAKEAIEGFIGSFPSDEQPQIRQRLGESLIGVMCQALVPAVNGKLVAIREIMSMNLNFREQITTSKMMSFESSLESDPKSVTLEQNLLKYVKEGVVDPSIALEYAKRPNSLKEDLEREGLIRSDESE